MGREWAGSSVFLQRGVQSQPEQPAMDLLGSILGSMDKPPSASEKERKLAKGSVIEK